MVIISRCKSNHLIVQFKFKAMYIDYISMNLKEKKRNTVLKIIKKQNNLPKEKAKCQINLFVNSKENYTTSL